MTNFIALDSLRNCLVQVLQEDTAVRGLYVYVCVCYASKSLLSFVLLHL